MSRQPHARPVLDEPDEEGLGAALVAFACLVVFVVAVILIMGLAS